MPFRRRYRRKRRFYGRRRRKYGRYKRYSRRRGTITRVPRGHLTSDKQLVTMRYHERLTFSPAIGLFTSESMRGNSVYDPWSSGTGHQPRGFDQLSVMYLSYYVPSSTISLKIKNNHTKYALVCLRAANTESVASFTDIRDMVEEPYSKYQAVAPALELANLGKLHNKMRTLKMYGGKYDDDMTSDIATNPALEWFWIISVQSGDPLSATAVDIEVDLTYRVLWFNRRTLATS